MTAARRILVLAPGVPHPVHGASTVLFFWYVAALAKAGFDVLVAPLLRGAVEDSQAALAEFERNVAPYGNIAVDPQPRAIPVVAPTRFSVVIDPAQDRLSRRVKAFRADVVLSFDLDAALLAADLDVAQRVVWLGDLQFDTVWYHYIYSVKESVANARHLPHALIRSSAWRRVYKTALQSANLVVASSASSVAKMKELGIDAVYEPYPWPNDTIPPKAAKPELPTFLFFGTLVGLGSRSSFHFMFERLYPEMRKRWGDGFKIYVSGREALPEWIKPELARRPEFQFLGFVDDIDALLSGVHAVLAPIDVPVGNRSRIVTAMAKRALVIAHPNVALGNPDLVNGATCLLAADPEDFAGHMRRAVEDVAAMGPILDRAQAVWYESFRPETAGKVMAKLIDRRLNEAARATTGHGKV